MAQWLLEHVPSISTEYLDRSASGQEAKRRVLIGSPAKHVQGERHGIRSVACDFPHVERMSLQGSDATRSADSTCASGRDDDPGYHRSHSRKQVDGPRVKREVRAAKRDTLGPRCRVARAPLGTRPAYIDSASMTQPKWIVARLSYRDLRLKGGHTLGGFLTEVYPNFTNNNDQQTVCRSSSKFRLSKAPPCACRK